MKKSKVDEVLLQKKRMSSDITSSDVSPLLLSNSSFFQSILNSSHHAIISMDLNLCVQFCNVKAEQLLGVPCEQLIGKNNPLGLDHSIVVSQHKNLFSQKVIPFDSVKVFSSPIVSNSVDSDSSFPILSSSSIIDQSLIKESPIKGYISGMVNENNQPIGYSCFLKQVKPSIESTVLSRKRTFDSIRLLILSELLSHRKTINQISKNISVNWKTVENHLTYLSGKKKIHEVFTSDYVRIFEITDHGKAFLLQQSSGQLKTANSSTKEAYISSADSAIKNNGMYPQNQLPVDTQKEVSSIVRSIDNSLDVSTRSSSNSSDETLSSKPKSSHDDDLLREVPK